MKLPRLDNIFDDSKFSLVNPPSMALFGSVTNLTGEVMWQGRIFDNLIKVNELESITQGEIVKTGEDGFLNIEFADKASIEILPNSKLEIVQTIPNNLVFYQHQGEVNYIKNSDIPVSVRSGRVLIDISEDLNLKVASSGFIYIKGNGKMAFNNKTNDTQVVELFGDKSIIFNDNNLEVVQE